MDYRLLPTNNRNTQDAYRLVNVAFAKINGHWTYSRTTKLCWVSWWREWVIGRNKTLTLWKRGMFGQTFRWGRRSNYSGIFFFLKTAKREDRNSWGKRERCDIHHFISEVEHASHDVQRIVTGARTSGTASGNHGTGHRDGKYNSKLEVCIFQFNCHKIIYFATAAMPKFSLYCFKGSRELFL